MSVAINSLVKAIRFDLHLEFPGQSNSGYALFLMLAKQLGTKLEEVVFKKDQPDVHVW